MSKKKGNSFLKQKTLGNNWEASIDIIKQNEILNQTLEVNKSKVFDKENYINESEKKFSENKR